MSLSLPVDQSNNEEILRECDEYISRLRLSIDMRIAKMREINETISSDQIYTLIAHSLETFSLLDTAQRYEEFVYCFNQRIRSKNTTLGSISAKLKGSTQLQDEFTNDEEPRSERSSTKSDISLSNSHGFSMIGVPDPISDPEIGYSGTSVPDDVLESVEGVDLRNKRNGEMVELNDRAQQHIHADVRDMPRHHPSFQKSSIDGKGVLHNLPDKSKGSTDERKDEDKTRVGEDSQYQNSEPSIGVLEATLSGNSLTSACYTTGLQTLVQQDPKLQGKPLRYAAISKLCELRIKAERYEDSMSREEVETCVKTKHVRLDERLTNRQTMLNDPPSPRFNRQIM